MPSASEQTFNIISKGHPTPQKPEQNLSDTGNEFWAKGSYKNPAQNELRSTGIIKNIFILLSELQLGTGELPGPTGTPLGVMPCLVFTVLMIGKEIPDPVKQHLIDQAMGVQLKNKGWPMHQTSTQPSLLATVFHYVMLRLLGVDRSDSRMKQTRSIIYQLGGALKISTFGKMWLAMLSLYNWAGVRPFLPELYLLPEWIPFSPFAYGLNYRWWWMLFTFISAVRFSIACSPLLEQIQGEIFIENYENIAWERERVPVDEELLIPTSGMYSLISLLHRLYDTFYVVRFRKKAIDHIARMIFCLESLKKSPDNMLSICLNSICTVICKSRLESTSDPDPSRLFRLFWPSKRGLDINLYSHPLLLSTIHFLDYAYPLLTEKEFQGVEVNIRRALDLVASRLGDPNAPMGDNGSLSNKNVSPVPLFVFIQGVRVLTLYSQLERYRNKNYTDLIPNAIISIVSRQNMDGSFGIYERKKGGSNRNYRMFVLDSYLYEQRSVESTSMAIILFSVYLRKDVDDPSIDIDIPALRAIEFLISMQHRTGFWPDIHGDASVFSTCCALSALGSVGYAYMNNEAVKRGCDFLVKQCGHQLQMQPLLPGVNEHSIVDIASIVLALPAVKYYDKSLVREGVHVCHLYMRQKFVSLDVINDGVGDFGNGAETCFWHLPFYMCGVALLSATRYLMEDVTVEDLPGQVPD